LVLGLRDVTGRDHAIKNLADSHGGVAGEDVDDRRIEIGKPGLCPANALPANAFNGVSFVNRAAHAATPGGTGMPSLLSAWPACRFHLAPNAMTHA
jgi:hypothetical protein